MDPSVRKLVWESLLDADFHARYFGSLAELQAKRERSITWSITVLSSGAVATFFRKGLSDLAPALSLVVVFLSASLNVLKFGKAATTSASLQRQWSAILSDLEALWTQIESGTIEPAEALKQRQKIDARHASLDEIASSRLSTSKRLVRQCWETMLQSRHVAPA